MLSYLTLYEYEEEKEKKQSARAGDETIIDCIELYTKIANNIFLDRAAFHNSFFLFFFHLLFFCLSLYFRLIQLLSRIPSLVCYPRRFSCLHQAQCVIATTSAIEIYWNFTVFVENWAFHSILMINLSFYTPVLAFHFKSGEKKVMKYSAWEKTESH